MHIWRQCWSRHANNGHEIGEKVETILAKCMNFLLSIWRQREVKTTSKWQGGEERRRLLQSRRGGSGVQWRSFPWGLSQFLWKEYNMSCEWTSKIILLWLSRSFNFQYYWQSGTWMFDENQHTGFQSGHLIGFCLVWHDIKGGKQKEYST